MEGVADGDEADADDGSQLNAKFELIRASELIHREIKA